MRRHKRLIAIALVLYVVIACSNPGGSGTPTPSAPDTLPTAPAPVASDDLAVTGVYKGIIATPTMSGSFWFDVQNGAKSFPAVHTTLNLLVGGKLYTVASDPSADNGSYYTISFKWVDSGVSYWLYFLVDQSGNFNSVNPGAFSVDSNYYPVAVAKETTTTAVQTWEGTFTGSAPSTTVSGVWNFTLAGSALSGTYQGTAKTSAGNQSTSGDFSGAVSGSTIAFSSAFGSPDTLTGSFSGTAVGSSVSGTWAWNDPAKGSGTWSGTRKQ